MGHTYDDVWARFYEHISPELAGDVEFYVNLARAADGPVVELGCGQGRVLFPVAAATAHPVIGLDLSDAMLARGRARLTEYPADVRARVDLRRGDMTDFALDTPAALALIPFRAFHHLLTVADQAACLACIRRALAPGGRVCINCFDPKMDMIAAHGRYLAGVPAPRVDFVDEATGHLVHVATAWRAWTPERQTFKELWTFTEFEGESVVEEHEALLELRYGFRWEMEHLFHRAGFAIEALYGDFKRGPFTYGGEQVWVLRHAPDSTA